MNYRKRWMTCQTIPKRWQKYPLNAKEMILKDGPNEIRFLILGETTEKVRNRILQGFDRGHIDTLIQNGILIFFVRSPNPNKMTEDNTILENFSMAYRKPLPNSFMLLHWS